ncbi:zinc finger protein 507 isoform X1 [Pygocentrus nattereri]|uniref:C2H2-type domain-containing protein n=1 Tax=Pygocentrus nattereri TaxID=42514 RepID=A0A3B4E2U4_PYGNA|nr:zinc finger protein 507 isoform X1 [Pygocentrus nattereri]
MEDSSGVAVLVPHPRGQQETVFVPDPHFHDDQNQHKQAADSLIQVIEKLSKIVEKRPRRCTLPGKKRPSLTCASVTVADSREGRGGASPCKMLREQDEEGHTRSCAPGPAVGPNVGGPRTVTCYQCSLCRFLSPTLSSLKEHLKQHDEHHSDLILMCSECRFTSSQQEELEAHVRLHFEQGARSRESLRGQTGFSTTKSETESQKIPAAPKKWYSYEHGRYRCLICSYECRQQRNLKTHAWKHAGLVDCSYPIFEDEGDHCVVNPVPTLSSSPSLAHSKEEEAIVVLTPVGHKGQVLQSSTSIQLELCAPEEVKCNKVIAGGAEELESPVGNVFSVQGPDPQEPLVEVQLTPEAQMELELELETESQQMSSDSLLSSAQKILSCSSNGSGHVNVIVERLPCAQEPVASKSLLLSPEVAGDKTLLASKEPGLENQPHTLYYEEQEEVVIGWSSGNTQHETEKGASGDSPPDENMPPARRRTHSECLRLHSLAAEALVAMPTRALELSKSTVKGMVGLGAQIPDTGQRIIELSTASASTVHSKNPSGSIPGPATLLNLGLSGVPQGSKQEVLVEGPSKAGISMSLLTVIERLRERSDQNASDEDILKELQDNAQSQHGGTGTGVVVGSGDPSIPEGSLVEYIAGSEKPYRCRLCLYSSGNKGYIKQHLRVHRQRQPYQCPICEHIASDSKDLESHMINHCKTRMYPCKHCSETFHYKSQLRNHEREQHGMGDTSTALTAVSETAASTDESEKMTEEADTASDQKVYKCDVCDYTSSTYVGVRNHRRIHNSDKPYRCCSCDFATTNMNSLKSHMKRHPQEHQAVQLLEQYRCSLCGYVCSHPPSLKSHMWKHAGDQNYNYEQVNKAINEAISQSSRSPIVPPNVILGRKEKTPPNVPAAAASTLGDGWRANPGEQALGAAGRKGGMGQVRTGMEYCMLLFCCCICGFESTSKEQLMEHMKEHEGDIISIILSKEQQGSQPAEASTVQ